VRFVENLQKHSDTFQTEHNVQHRAFLCLASTDPFLMAAKEKRQNRADP